MHTQHSYNTLETFIITEVSAEQEELFANYEKMHSRRWLVSGKISREFKAAPPPTMRRRLDAKVTDKEGGRE